MREIAISAAKKAGSYLISNFNQIKEIKYDSEGIYSKNPQAISSFDVESEKIIVNLIRDKYPLHGFLTEEGIRSGQKTEYTWIIDGLDGTTQYVRGLPYFSISIALLHNNNIVLGVVFLPYQNELFVAEKTKGAYLNNNSIHVSSNSDSRTSLIASSTFGSYRLSSNEYVFTRLINSYSHVRIFGSPAIDLCNVACGRLDARITASTKPWDHSAGCLILEESGGKVTDWSGNNWSSDSKNLIATNSHLQDELLSIP